MTRRHGVLPGFFPALTFTWAYVGLLVLAPLGALLVQAVRLGGVQLEAVIAPRALAAYDVSFSLSIIAGVINGFIGLLLAWVLTRYRFPGRALVDALVDLPFALPTAVAGLTLTALYAPTGPLGRLLAPLGVTVAFTRIGVVIALTFVGLPFAVRTVQPVLADLDRDLEEAAATLGANRWQTFTRVIVPNLLPAVLTGFTLAFARALGEYGSIVFISGNLPFKTEIVPLLIVTKLEQYDYGGATALGVVMMFASFALLFAINALQRWTAKRRGIGEAQETKPGEPHERRGRVLTEAAPVRGALVGGALALVALFLVVPLAAVFAYALREGPRPFLSSIGSPDALAAIRLTLVVAAIAVPLNTLFGVSAAWVIARFRFAGKTLLTTLIDLPFAVSPVIAGLSLVLLFGRQGLLGPWLTAHDFKVIFALPGIVLGTAFVTFPLVAREVLATMQAQGSHEEEAALTLGANGWQTFRRVTLPKIKWGVLYGVVLCNARAMGEFGAVSVVSGHIRGVTTTMPLHAEILYNEYNFVGAFAIASLLAGLALVTLIAKRLLERRAHPS